MTVHDKHPARLAKDLILHSAEVIHPDLLTPSNSATNLDEEDLDIKAIIAPSSLFDILEGKPGYSAPLADSDGASDLVMEKV